jgi:CDP-diacylglycerol--glycerol-3-phosphate 3-phosphatidyltransferase
MDRAPAWMVLVIIGREFAVTALRGVAYARGVVIAASPLGKFKMVSQVVAILALILGSEPGQPLYLLGRLTLWVATITALASAIDYYRRFNDVLGVQRVHAQDVAKGAEVPAVRGAQKAH